MNLNFAPKQYRCRICKSIIYSTFEGDFVSCRCGAISIDQTKHYTRMVGPIDNFELLQERKHG